MFGPQVGGAFVAIIIKNLYRGLKYKYYTNINNK